MKNLVAFIHFVCVIYLVVLLADVLTGAALSLEACLLMACGVALYLSALEAGLRLPRLVWQSPRLFRNSGLFLKCGDRRWRLLRWMTR